MILGLIGNTSVLNKSPIRNIGGTTLSCDRSNFNTPGQERNVYAGEGGFANFNAIPNGYVPPYSWVIAVKPGGMASYKQISGSGTTTNVNLAGGIGIASTINGLGSISSSPISGPGNVSATGITGSGSFQTNPIMSGALLASANPSGSGSITNAADGARVGMLATLSGSGSISADSKGAGQMSADITPFTPLSPQSLSETLLDLNDIETGFSLREAVRLMLSALAGKISGAETTTVTIRNVVDDKNRIVATVDTNGNRTSISYDVS